MRAHHAVTQANNRCYFWSEAGHGGTSAQKENPGTLMLRGRVEEEKEPSQTKTKKAAEVPALSRVTLRGLKLAIGALVSVGGEQPSALI